MTELTRRRVKDSKVDVWHVYYGDVQVGTMRSGVPNDVDQWGWICGFNSQRLKIAEGTAPTFVLALAKFEEAWQVYLLGCIDADFAEHREQRAWTTWPRVMGSVRPKVSMPFKVMSSESIMPATLSGRWAASRIVRSAKRTVSAPAVSRSGAPCA
ncbi:hypothetical protein [Bradyrhizobium sp. URHD0069]|uniref:hypothetical protein n=1 Tax=Bradyrhizobium sp. URHD0069 TaxID=1380355 RepID=UPI000497E0F7|nr:hypothetical protein [Bradyrhizobium sp. URHD0069]